jgi:hypothetical protein
MKILAAAVLALVSSVQTPATPNFSGDWKMNPGKSDFGGLPAPSSMTRTITHAEPLMKIVETQRSDMGDQNTTRTYTINGSPTTFTSQGAEVRTQAEWAGATLLVTSSVEAIGVTFKDRMTLSADGRTLTSLVHIASPQGEVDITVVFEKQ